MAMAVDEVRIHGLRIAVRVEGSGPVLLLLHGMAGSGSTWFVEQGPSRVGTPDIPDELRLDGESGRLLRAYTVPAGWEGD